MIELLKKKMGMKNALKSLGLSRGQLQYIETLMSTEHGCEQLVSIRSLGRKRVITSAHIQAVKTIIEA